MALGTHGQTDDERVIRSFTPREIDTPYTPPDMRAGPHPDTVATTTPSEGINRLFTAANSHARYTHQGRYRLVELAQRLADVQRIIRLRRLAAVQSGATEGCRNQEQRDHAVAQWLRADDEHQEATREADGLQAAIDTLKVDVELDDTLCKLYKATLYALGGVGHD